MVPSPPATRIRFAPPSITSFSRDSSCAGFTTSRSNPTFRSASRAASAFPHSEFRNALSFEVERGEGAVWVADTAVSGRREEGRRKRKREEGRGKREEGEGTPTYT